MTNEHLEQAALFQWAILNEKKYPALCNLFSIPNGGKLPYVRTGKGKIWSGQRFTLVKEGLKKGVPDIFLAWPAGKKHGLFIEMKYGKNKVSPEQQDWIERLAKTGYVAVVCYGFEEARDCIVDYINGYY